MAQISRLKDAETENGNIIDADDLDAEFDQLVSAHNTNDTELTNIGTSAYTFSGVKTFSSTPLMNAISERTAASGVTIDSVLCKDGMVTVSGTPTVTGQIGYASNRLKYHNGTSVITVPDYGMVSSVTARSSNTILAAADIGGLFVCTSTFTQTLTAAATLGSAWFVHIRNDGTGIITIDPNSSETVDGQTTIAVYPGEAFTLVCDGSNFKTIGRHKGEILILEQTASASTSVDFTVGLTDTEFKYFKFVIKDLVPATNDTGMQIRVSEDAGSSWKSGASDYYYGYSDGNSLTSPTGDTEIQTYNSTATTMIQNGAGKSAAFDILLFNPASTTLHKRFRGEGIWEDSNTNSHRNWEFSGSYKGTTNAITGVRFLMSSGNITSGSFQLYGVR